jgi:hypothetical protein
LVKLGTSLTVVTERLTTELLTAKSVPSEAFQPKLSAPLKSEFPL